ncbi:MAG: hypothetical protein LBP85_01895 [Prevotellaceae bacterium]|jgi:hypothetical protein|nr:hypothetical protein [Prevotellaceae bacterium]
MKTVEKSQDVTVIKLIYSSTYSDYIPVLYEIEIGDELISHISEATLQTLYEQIGATLSKKKEGAL